MNHASLENWLLTAETSCQPSTPFLVIMCGVSGSGKSTASRFLAEQYQAAWIRSDIERKRLFGLAPDQSSHHLHESIYTPAATLATFQAMIALAEQLLMTDYPVILDSCALKLSEREAFRQTAQQRQLPSFTIYCQSSPETLFRRIQQRQMTEQDPSEANQALMSKQLSWLEIPSTNETSNLMNLNLEAIYWQKNLSKAVNSLLHSHSNEDRR